MLSSTPLCPSDLPIESVLFGEQDLHLATLTICGPHREKKVQTALRSAAWADVHVLLDTDQEGSEKTVAAAMQTARENGVLAFYASSHWKDFSSARNAVLDAARQQARKAKKQRSIGIFLDTDEVLLFGPNPRAHIAELVRKGFGNLSTPDRGASYTKARAFDLSEENGVRFIGRTHEYNKMKLPSIIVPFFRFAEGAKPPVEHIEKFERDERLLEEEIRDSLEPGADLLDESTAQAGMLKDEQLSRWYFYLGNAKLTLGRDDWQRYLQISAAIDRSFPEQAAWCHWLIAKDHYVRSLDEHDGIKQSERKTLLDLAHRAFAHYPLAEAAWLMSKVYWQMGRNFESLSWARSALSMMEVPRLNFRELEAPKWIFDLFQWLPCAPGEKAMVQKALRAIGAKELTTNVPHDTRPKNEIAPTG